MALFRIRWQETWDDQLQGYVDDAFTMEEAVGLLRGLAVDWFPGGFELVQDEDSPLVWAAHEVNRSRRTVWLFLEPIG